ncbi:MAG: hypothetical protein WC507_00290 [Candidatus Paceibacterota bacterium]|jgi:hypothetical protein
MKKNIFKILFIFLPIIILGFFMGLNLEIKITNASCSGGFCPLPLQPTPPATNNPPTTDKPSSNNNKTCKYKICSQNNLTGKVFCATQSSSDPNCQSRSNCTNDSDCGSSNNVSNTTNNTSEGTSGGSNITPQALINSLPPEVINSIKAAALKELGGIQAAMQFFKDLGLAEQMSFDNFLLSYGSRMLDMSIGVQIGLSNSQKTEIPEFKDYVWEVGLPGLVKPEGSLPLGEGGVPALVAYFIKVALRISGLLVFAMITYAGFQYLTAGGNANKQKEAQERITSAVIGLLLLFAFYIILNTINPDILKTEISAQPTAAPPAQAPPAQAPPAGQPPAGNLVNIKAMGIPLDYATLGIPSNSPVFLDSSLADKLNSLKNINPAWHVHDACINSNIPCLTTHNVRPTGDCHYYGTCVDIDSVSGSPSDNKKLIEEFTNAGLYVLDEGNHLHVALPTATGHGSYQGVSETQEGYHWYPPTQGSG